MFKSLLATLITAYYNSIIDVDAFLKTFKEDADKAAFKFAQERKVAVNKAVAKLDVRADANEKVINSTTEAIVELKTVRNNARVQETVLREAIRIIQS